MRVAVFVAVFVCAIGAAEAADLAQVGPNATARSLMDARGVIKEPGLEIVYQITGTKPAVTLTIDIAQDFTVVSASPTNETIYDYALRRVVTLDDVPHNFQNVSLYALVDFFAAATNNRRTLRTVLKAGGAKGVAANDPFFVQSELHVMDPEDGVPKIARRVAKDGSVHFFYANKDVASYALSAQKLTPEQSAAFAKFLRMGASLHPAIIDEIAATGRLPKQLSFALPPAQNKPAAVWVLQSAVAVRDAYPLQAGAHPVPLPPGDAAATAFAPLLPVMQGAVAGTAPGHKTVEDFHKSIEAALDKQQYFQAVVSSLELNLQYGEAAATCAAQCHSLKEVLAAAKDDPRTQAMLKALKATGGDDLAAAIKTLADLKRDDLANPTVVDDFLANDLIQAGRPGDALPLFAAAIKANPYMPGYYKGMGDAYRHGFEPALAWLCYDMGRSLPGSDKTSVMSAMNDYEAELAKKYPQFF